MRESRSFASLRMTDRSSRDRLAALPKETRRVRRRGGAGGRRPVEPARHRGRAAGKELPPQSRAPPLPGNQDGKARAPLPRLENVEGLGPDAAVIVRSDAAPVLPRSAPLVILRSAATKDLGSRTQNRDPS